MQDLNHVLQETKQMFIGEQLYYALKKHDFALLEKYAVNNPTTK